MFGDGRATLLLMLGSGLADQSGLALVFQSEAISVDAHFAGDAAEEVKGALWPD